MKYVIAKARRLVIVHQYASMCDGQPCIRTDAEYTLECMTDEQQHKYRVRRLAHGYCLYTTCSSDFKGSGSGGSESFKLRRVRVRVSSNFSRLVQINFRRVT